MHNVSIRPHILERVMARRGRVHWFDTLDPARTALVVIDMQETFCAPGAPAEVAQSRDIVPGVNAVAAGLRAMGAPVIFVLHANTHRKGVSDWELFFHHVVSDEVRLRTMESLAPGRQQVWRGLEQHESDVIIVKNRYSALISGASPLERVLRNLGVDTLLIAGTKTNVCCEATARDAMMLNYKVAFISDGCATFNDAEHNATLDIMAYAFADVMSTDECLALLASAAPETTRAAAE